MATPIETIGQAEIATRIPKNVASTAKLRFVSLLRKSALSARKSAALKTERRLAGIDTPPAWAWRLSGWKWQIVAASAERFDCDGV